MKRLKNVKRDDKMTEDPIEPDLCIICGLPTTRKWITYPESERDDIPMCEKCQTFTSFFKITESIEKFKERRDGIDIARTIAKMMKEKGYEHYNGQCLNGTENRFFVKGSRLVQVIVEECADAEILEAITGEEVNEVVREKTCGLWK